MKTNFAAKHKIEQKFGTNRVNGFMGSPVGGHTGMDFNHRFDKTQRTMKNGMTAVGIVFFLVALALTVVSVVLAVNVSGWFFIATLIVGGYTLIAGIMVILQRKMLSMVERDW